MNTGPVHIRKAFTSDFPGIAETRASAIQSIAPQYYEQDLLEEWAGAVDARVEILRTNDADVRIVAEINGRISESNLSGKLPR